MRAPRYSAIAVMAVTASTHAVEQNALNPDAPADNALAITTAPDVALAVGRQYRSLNSRGRTGPITKCLPGQVSPNVQPRRRLGEQKKTPTAENTP